MATNTPFGLKGIRKFQRFDVASTTLSGAEAAGQTVLSVTSTTGMSSASGKNGVRILLDDLTWHQTTISSIGSGTITVAAALPSNAASGKIVVATSVTTFTIPASVIQNGGVMYATYCGGGQGGAGGHATGGGGGGGGASSTFHEIPIYIDTSVSDPKIDITVGHGGAGGAVGANGQAGAITRMDDYASNGALLFPLPTGRCARNASSQAVAGAAADGGKGGDGGSMITAPLVTATSELGIECGPSGGAAGTGATDGGYGRPALARGFYGTTGAGGGGGGSTTSNGGSGGADTKHGDQSPAIGGGGAGGGSFIGGAAYGGDPAGDARGSDANGPGAGGGGGGTGGIGGNGGEGVVILSWVE